MRTTIELPPELLRAAKARSAELGESLKSLLTRAVAADLADQAPTVRSARSRVPLPIFGRPSPTAAALTNGDLERALAASDVEEAATAVSSRGGSRRRKHP